MILDEIAAHKRVEVEARKRQTPLESLVATGKTRDFYRAIGASGLGFSLLGVDYGFRNIGLSFGTGRKRIPKVIAEVKKASPSKGIIRPDFDWVSIAKSYEKAGAAAISVLTDEAFFQGQLQYLTDCRLAVRIPALRKDFIIDTYQLHEARAAGADAVLLIAALLDTATLRDFRRTALHLGMESLVEVHDERELDSALESDAAIIGINNRNLQTFEVDIETTFRLAPMIPQVRIKVSESGISTHDDLKRLADIGVDAVLIGETFMRAPDPGAKLRELIHG